METISIETDGLGGYMVRAVRCSILGERPLGDRTLASRSGCLPQRRAIGGTSRTNPGAMWNAE
jgi:hypothetical protein